jgi:predicted Zn-dependent protease
LEGFEEALGHLRESLPEVDLKKPRTAAARRGKEAIVFAYHAELAFRRDKPKTARKHLDNARQLNPDLPHAKRLDCVLLFEEGKHEKARKAAKRRLEDRPDDPQIATILVRSLLQLGWADLAKLELADWPRRYPDSEAELLQLWEETREVLGEGESQPDWLISELRP